MQPELERGEEIRLSLRKAGTAGCTVGVAVWDVIDGVINGLGRATVSVSKGEGRFDNGIIDGLVNVTGNAIYALGDRLRRVQTGYLRSYILFLVLAVVALFIVLSYFVAMASAR